MIDRYLNFTDILEISMDIFTKISIKKKLTKNTLKFI